MQVEKEVVVKVKTTDGKTILLGDMVVLTARGYTYVGRYLGISRRGGISFRRLKNGRRTGKILDYAVRYIQNLQMQCGIADGR